MTPFAELLASAARIANGSHPLSRFPFTER
jgi:hypothetical protein